MHSVHAPIIKLTFYLGYKTKKPGLGERTTIYRLFSAFKVISKTTSITGKPGAMIVIVSGNSKSGTG